MNVLCFLFKAFVLNQLSHALITGNLENNWYNRPPIAGLVCRPSTWTVVQHVWISNNSHKNEGLRGFMLRACKNKAVSIVNNSCILSTFSCNHNSYYCNLPGVNSRWFIWVSFVYLLHILAGHTNVRLSISFVILFFIQIKYQRAKAKIFFWLNQ